MGRHFRENAADVIESLLVRMPNAESIPRKILEECVNLLKSGQNVEAIRFLRDDAEMSLRDAKQTIEAMIEGLFDD